MRAIMDIFGGYAGDAPQAKKLPDGVPLAGPSTAFAKGTGDAHDVDINDIKQGNIGDCFLLASMGAMAHQNPDSVKSLVSENRDKDGNLTSYTVTLKKKVKGTYIDVPITVDPSKFPKDGKHAQMTGDTDGGGRNEIWPLLIEKAYAQMRGGYDKIGGGGWPADAMATLTGVDSEKKKPGKHSYDALEQDLAAGKGVAFSTRDKSMWEKTKEFFGGKTNKLGHGLVHNHSYTVTGVETDEHGNRFVVVNNPWGGPNAAQRVPYNDIKGNFDDIAVNAGMAKK
jgi:hypothetical protein